MELEDPAAMGSRGLLTVTSYSYVSVSTSAVLSWEFAATDNLAVYYVLEAIRNKGRANYDMTTGGVGCRYWIFVVMADLVALTYVSSTSFDEATMQSIIGYNYSVNMAPVLLEVKKGTFLEDSQSFSAGTASSSTSYQATTSSQAPIQLQDDDYVTTTLVKLGRDVASSFYRFHTNLGAVEKKGDQFFQARHQNGAPCMVYYGVNSQRYYWTWELDQGRG